VPGVKNIQAHPFVERSKIVLPPLHIKMLIKKKGLDQKGDCFICVWVYIRI